MGKPGGDARKGRKNAGKTCKKNALMDTNLRNAIAKVRDEFRKMDFGGTAREIVEANGFGGVENKSMRANCRAMLIREMTVLLLQRGKRIKKMTTAGNEMLFLLGRASRIEIWLWKNRKSAFPVSRALEMYQAASQIERKVSPKLPARKEKLVGDVKKALESEIRRLKAIKSKSPNEAVKVRAPLLSVAAKAGIRKANSLKPKAGIFANLGSDKIQKAAMEALPIKWR